MGEADQVANASDWRRHLKNMRTLRLFQAGAADPRRLGEAVDRLKPGVLQAAVENPDHSDAGRAAAAAALKGRGIALEPWRLAVPGFISGVDLDRGPKLFFGAGRAVRKWSGIAIFLAVMLLTAGAAWFASADESRMHRYVEETAACEYHDQCSGEIRHSDNFYFRHVWSEERYRYFLEQAGQDGDPPASIHAIGLGVGIPLLVWLFSTAFRRKPARVVLLRKFNVRGIGNALSSMIQNEMRPYGHVIGLSDKHIKRDTFGWLSMSLLSLSNPLAGLWFVIGAPVRLVYRQFDRSGMGPAVVLNARDYRNLARRLRDRIGLNLQVALTSKESFLVRTSDAWWKLCARLLLESSDAVVVDLSQIAAGTEWELDVIRDSDAAARCVFVSLWGKGEDAQAALTKRGLTNPCHLYAPDGHMLDRAKFRAAMFSAMRASHA